MPGCKAHITTSARIHACCTHAVGAAFLMHSPAETWCEQVGQISKAKELKGQIPEQQHRELCNNKTTSFFPLSRHKACLLTEGQTDSYPCTFTYCRLQKIPVPQIACQRKSWMITEGYDTVRAVAQCVSSALQGCSLRLASLEEH